MSTVECRCNIPHVVPYFAQHYPAAVEAILSHSSVNAQDEGVLVCRDSFTQQLASPKHPTHFQWGFRSENALAIRDANTLAVSGQS
ncbi:hypothetical protein TNCV_3560631 [Trichonephila clavipes]|nr:hypothetical protein TNCV_3560631 [Trichonephila clavipes]